jgi:hypothetical protein
LKEHLGVEPEHARDAAGQEYVMLMEPTTTRYVKKNSDRKYIKNETKLER